MRESSEQTQAMGPESTDAAISTAAPAATVGETPATNTPDKTDAPVERRQRKSDECFSGSERRQSVVDRRAGIDRRAIDIGAPTGLERRRGPGRRRSDDRRSAEEGEMTDEQFEFVLAIDTYKRLNNRPFPSWTEVLEVIKQLGYRKVAASQLQLPGGKSGAPKSDDA